MGVGNVESSSAVTSLARAYDSTLAATAGGGAANQPNTLMGTYSIE